MSSYESSILITGGTTGLGYECAYEVAKQKPNSLIIICSRSSGEDAVRAINQETGRRNAKYLRLDLGDLSNIRTFASEFTKNQYPPISALVLNAGLQVMDLKHTPDGVETTFGVNHVGHALLFYLLAQHLTRDARIVLTSSGTHDPAQKTGVPDATYQTAELMAHPDSATRNNTGRQRYSSSKLCNVLWTYALDRHRESQGITWNVNAFDPGLMPGTGLAREASAVLQFLWHYVLPYIVPVLRTLVTPNVHTAKESGQALARLAISPEVEGVSGKYFEGLKEIESSKDSYDKAKQENIWDWTGEFLGRDDKEREAFKKLDVYG